MPPVATTIVYLAMHWDYDNDYPLGVFSTAELGKAACESDSDWKYWRHAQKDWEWDEKKKCWAFMGWCVYEIELDARMNL